MSDRPLFTWTPIIVALGSMLGAGSFFGFLVGRYTAEPTLSTMEAVIDRAGMRWSEEDTRRYCSESGYMHPAWDATLAGAEVLPARDGADVGTLVCYWKLKR
jgi:hypothetical protein